jgi:hypothetical protein
MTAPASCRVRMAGRTIGSTIQRADGLWDCSDASGKPIAAFPNRARAIDALVARASRVSGRSNIGASLKLEPHVPNGASAGRETGDPHAPALSCSMGKATISAHLIGYLETQREGGASNSSGGQVADG